MISSVLESVDATASLRGAWDRLAIEAGRPYSTPAWVLAWWACMRPSGADMRVIAVRREEELVGIFPLLAVGRRYRPIGGDLAAVEPLAKRGLEREVASTMALAMASLRPRPATISLQAQGDCGDWAELLSSGWPERGVWQQRATPIEVPGIDFGDGDFETWIGTKSSSFRRETRRKAKRLAEAGGSFRFASEASLGRDVDAFLRLHRARLSARGGSSLEAEGVDRMLCQVGRELLPLDRFRLLLLEVDGNAVGAQVVVAAGTEASAWNSGFDEDYAKLSPSMQCILHVIRDSLERGGRTMSLGPGEQAYKARLADHSVDLVSHTLVPRGRGYAGARSRIAAASARRAARAQVGRIVPQSIRRMKGTARREAKL